MASPRRLNLITHYCARRYKISVFSHNTAETSKFALHQERLLQDPI